MKILIVSTSDLQGGAAIAAFRLMDALNAREGVSAKMVVRDKRSESDKVIAAGGKNRNKWNFVTERAQIFVHNRLSRRNLFDVSTASSGVAVTSLEEFREADVIHLHWINQGMLSLKEIERIIDSGKRVVWTMHDMWAFTGICHHAAGCTRYETGCGMCPYLAKPSEGDLSARVFREKLRIYKDSKIEFVAVSSWLKRKAEAGKLMNGQNICVIPNALDTEVFKPGVVPHKRLAQLSPNRYIMTMGAARLDAPIKGFEGLKKSLHCLLDKYKYKGHELLLVLYGSIKFPKDFFEGLPVEYLHLGTLSNTAEIASVFAASDVVLVPSLYETFGQTITEAMACGCAAVSYDNSGQTDIIEHRVNGYLARYGDNSDFAGGIDFVLKQLCRKEDIKERINKTTAGYAGKVVAQQYFDLYEGR